MPISTPPCSGYKSTTVWCNDYTESLPMTSVRYDFVGEPAAPPAGEFLLGRSPAMLEVFRLIERVGPTEASVLLTGESGCGKELAPRAIHPCSARSAGPFVAINCGAIPRALMEAER